MEVGRRTIAGVALVVVALVAAVAFLLGRESTRQPPPPSPSPSSPPSSPPSPPPSPTGDAAPVRDYFARVAAIQEGPAGNPSSVANELVAASIGGDSSGFDKLIQGAEDGLAKLREVQPPPACAEYHRKLTALLGDGLAMLRSLKNALGHEDTDGLAGLAAQASALQQRTSDLDAEAAAIKARFGLH